MIVGDGIAFLFGKGWRNYELYIANIVTGKIRKLLTANGNLLVDDSDIDYDAIAQESENGIGNAQSKVIRYAGLNRWARKSGRSAARSAYPCCPRSRSPPCRPK